MLQGQTLALQEGTLAQQGGQTLVLQGGISLQGLIWSGKCLFVSFEFKAYRFLFSRQDDYQHQA